MDSLKKSFEEEKIFFDRYRGDILKLQSYLLRLTLNYHVKNDFKIFKSRIVQIMRNANPPPDTELLEMLSRYQGGYTEELIKFWGKLQSLLSGEPLCPPTPQSGLTNSLAHVVRTEIRTQSILSQTIEVSRCFVHSTKSIEVFTEWQTSHRS